MKNPTPVFDPKTAGRKMRIAAFMSGSGSNIRRLLESKSGAYQISFIFSDRLDETCQGPAIAHEYGLPYFSFDIRQFHFLKNIKRTIGTEQGLKARKEYDSCAQTLLKAFEVDIIALGGYMSFTTLKSGVNVHPADLSLKDENGNRRFVGDDAVKDAILAGQTQLRSSTLWIDQGVDSGPLLLVSDPLEVKLPLNLPDLEKDPQILRKVVDQHQEELKRIGDWVIFPLTLDLIAQGRIAIDSNNTVYLDGEKKPKGIRISDLSQSI